MSTTRDFTTSLDIDTPWGNLQFDGVVEHENGRIVAITASYDGTDYERAEAAIGSSEHASPASSALARALWPLLVAEITRAHRYDELATVPERRHPRHAVCA